MKFKIDENLPIELSELLQRAGYEAMTVPEQHLGGRPDTDIASVCQKEGRILVTLDTDFADIRRYPPQEFSGLIVLRLIRQDKPHVLEVFEHLIKLFSKEPLDHHLWMVEEKRVRIRG